MHACFLYLKTCPFEILIHQWLKYTCTHTHMVWVISELLCLSSPDIVYIMKRKVEVICVCAHMRDWWSILREPVLIWFYACSRHKLLFLMGAFVYIHWICVLIYDIPSIPHNQDKSLKRIFPICTDPD